METQIENQLWMVLCTSWLTDSSLQSHLYIPASNTDSSSYLLCLLHIGHCFVLVADEICLYLTVLRGWKLTHIYLHMLINNMRVLTKHCCRHRVTCWFSLYLLLPWHFIQDRKDWSLATVNKITHLSAIEISPSLPSHPSFLFIFFFQPLLSYSNCLNKSSFLTRASFTEDNARWGLRQVF